MSDLLDKKSVKSRFPILGLDAYSPDEVANRVVSAGVKKIRLPVTVTIFLGILGGCYISLGALYQLVVMANPAIGSGTAAIVGPLFFAMGYIIAFVTGAEIFTTNNLAAMSLASGKITILEMSRNWAIVLFANGIGAMALVILFLYSGLITLFDGLLLNEILVYDSLKLDYSALQMLIQGLLANLLICSGAWLAMAGRSVTDKFLALLIPLSAVPAMGLQHTTGNMFHFFLSLMVLSEAPELELFTDITLGKTLLNLVMVSLGNIIGGAILVAFTYYLIYVRTKW